ncbi:hypothetical protein AALP_AA6G140200 [Arabis alpina]|uniref:Uncharacterized protein n=1 Tax=Arabis alpina TaxID=50452 RepID=A0A087GP43_ARAAL|nr:hypothetical protein AALP_AA6G140200 [Arabis alpina]
MWCREDRCGPGGGYWTPPPTWNQRRRVYTAMPMSERKRTSSSFENQEPSCDSPYIRAKHAQLICKDLDQAISLFWDAINAGDRVDSALKDMVAVMQQLDRSDEGIEAIKSFRYLCPFESQDSIDNLLLELYKKSGRIQEEAELLEHKLKNLEQGTSLGGRITIAKRSHGKQTNMTIEQEKARILGNLAWLHLQLHNYGIAEQYYRNALSLEPDNNKLCNLAICLMRMDRIPEAKSLLEDVRQSLENQWKDESVYKSFERATEMLAERERATVADSSEGFTSSSSSDNFSSNCSFTSWVKEKQALDGYSREPGIMNKNNLHVSSETVGQNSPGLITQPRECKWDDEGVYQRTGMMTMRIGAARMLRFGKPLEAKHYEKEKCSKISESAASVTNYKERLNGKNLDQNLIEDLHQFVSGNALPMTSQARKLCADLVEEKEQNEKGHQRNASESSAYAQIMDIGRRTV